MQTATFDATIALSCSDAFNLASDLHSYPDFLPMVKSVDLSDATANGVKAHFKFNLDGALGTLVKKFSVTTTEQQSKITWKKDQEIVAENIKGPLKAITMQCHMAPAANNQTKINLKIDFETGMGWLIDKAALFYMKSQGAEIIQNIDSVLSEVLARRQKHTP
jgi:ribosome-associated toxin RatA of RatAB toxin-antitoxin module